MTTMTHTTLGDRWIYDACHDPVYVTALVTTVLTGGREADLFVATDAGLVQEVNTTHVHGCGSVPETDVPRVSTPAVTHGESTTRIDAGIVVTLLRVPAPSWRRKRTHADGNWPGQEAPLLLTTIDGPP